MSTIKYSLLRCAPVASPHRRYHCDHQDTQEALGRNRSSALHTIPQIMASDETLISNPVRPVREGSKVVFSPRDLRENKGTELRFFAQDPVVTNSIGAPTILTETVAPQDTLFRDRPDDDEGYVGGDGEDPYSTKS